MGRSANWSMVRMSRSLRPSARTTSGRTALITSRSGSESRPCWRPRPFGLRFFRFKTRLGNPHGWALWKINRSVTAQGRSVFVGWAGVTGRAPVVLDSSRMIGSSLDAGFAETPGAAWTASLAAAGRVDFGAAPGAKTASGETGVGVDNGVGHRGAISSGDKWNWPVRSGEGNFNRSRGGIVARLRRSPNNLRPEISCTDVRDHILLPPARSPTSAVM